MSDKQNKAQGRLDSHARERPKENHRDSPGQDHATQEKPAQNSAHEEMLEWLRRVRFRKKLIGGVSEQDVWRRLEELNALYEKSLAAERGRYDAMLAAYAKATNTKFSEYQKSAGAKLAECRKTIRALQEENRALRQSGKQKAEASQTPEKAAKISEADKTPDNPVRDASSSE